jgi:hypothetical protein
MGVFYFYLLTWKEILTPPPFMDNPFTGKCILHFMGMQNLMTLRVVNYR